MQIWIGSEIYVNFFLNFLIHLSELFKSIIGHLYVKSDVYGFGVVLLEILTGLRALDLNRPSEQQNLVKYAKPFLADRRKLSHIMDQRMDGQYNTKGVLKAAQLSLKCLNEDPKNRPSMKEVLETLERIEAIKRRSKDMKLSSTSLSCTRTGTNNRSQRGR
jgi:serine/threonine protein kinase